jgi:hypothetical protein
MYAASTAHAGRGILPVSVAAIFKLVILAAIGRQTLQSAEAGGPPTPTKNSGALPPLAEQPPPKIIVDAPKPEPLTRGVVILQFRTENFQIRPVFGPAAAAVSPWIGHLHITLDDAPWHWGHTSNDPVIVATLTPGPHKVLFELADANHNVLAQEAVKFDVPRP